MERFDDWTEIKKGIETGGESAIDTQIEVDLICGGVGFDDEPIDRDKWLEHLREVRKKETREV